MSEYLSNFFRHRRVPNVGWELIDRAGAKHYFDSRSVVETILDLGTPKQQAVFESRLREMQKSRGKLIDLLKAIAQEMVNDATAFRGEKPDICSRCFSNLKHFPRSSCYICSEERSFVRPFQLQLPIYTIDLIKSKHKNISAYLRGLIAKDLGPDAFPPEAINRPGGGKLKIKADI